MCNDSYYAHSGKSEELVLVQKKRGGGQSGHHNSVKAQANVCPEDMGGSGQ